MPRPQDIPVRIDPDAIDDANIPYSEDLDAELAEKRKRRDFQEEGYFYYIRMVAVCFCACIALIVVCIYIWHIVAPTNLCWLDVNRLSRIENAASMIIVGVIGTLSASYFLKK